MTETTLIALTLSMIVFVSFAFAVLFIDEHLQVRLGKRKKGSGFRWSSVMK